MAKRDGEVWSPQDDPVARRGLDEVQALVAVAQAAARSAGLVAHLTGEEDSTCVGFSRPRGGQVVAEYDPRRRRARVGGGPWLVCRDVEQALAWAVELLSGEAAGVQR